MLKKEEKSCGSCKKVLPYSSFSKLKRSSDGYQHRCKKCAAIASKKSRAKVLLSAPMCSASFCDRKSQTAGYCNKHYLQMNRHGKVFEFTICDPHSVSVKNGIATITVWQRDGSGREFTIDEVDLEKVKLRRWRFSKEQVFSQINDENPKSISLGRYLTDCPENMLVYHKNKNPFNCQQENLIVTDRQTVQINTKMNKRNKSGERGVFFDKRRDSWYAHLTIKGEKKQQGPFDLFEDAVKARKDLEEKYWGGLNTWDDIQSRRDQESK